MAQPIKHHHLDSLDDPVLPVFKRGRDLLTDPMLNKGTGFPDSERDALGIRGLVSPQVVSIDDQVSRAMENFRRQEHDLDRYIFQESLHDRNETLYYRVLPSNIRELTPIIYTPTVGKACSHFGHIYRRARGMYFGAAELPYFEEMVRNWPEEEIDIVVVTDGSRILGLGDLGANGMGIPIGKLSLYVLGAGIYPYRTLPVMLDLGTGNRALREDPLYLGERRERLRGEGYYEAVDAFIRAVHGRWPQALIQFEDFSNDHAFPPPEPLPRPHPLPQRRHPGHRSCRPGRHPERHAYHRRTARRSARGFPGGRLRRPRHRGHAGRGDDVGRGAQPGAGQRPHLDAGQQTAGHPRLPGNTRRAQARLRPGRRAVDRSKSM